MICPIYWEKGVEGERDTTRRHHTSNQLNSIANTKGMKIRNRLSCKSSPLCMREDAPQCATTRETVRSGLFSFPSHFSKSPSPALFMSEGIPFFPIVKVSSRDSYNQPFTARHSSFSGQNNKNKNKTSSPLVVSRCPFCSTISLFLLSFSFCTDIIKTESRVASKGQRSFSI